MQGMKLAHIMIFVVTQEVGVSAAVSYSDDAKQPLEGTPRRDPVQIRANYRATTLLHARTRNARAQCVRASKACLANGCLWSVRTHYRIGRVLQSSSPNIDITPRRIAPSVQYITISCSMHS